MAVSNIILSCQNSVSLPICACYTVFVNAQMVIVTLLKIRPHCFAWYTPCDETNHSDNVNLIMLTLATACCAHDILCMLLEHTHSVCL